MINSGILNPQILSLPARVRHPNALVIADRDFGDDAHAADRHLFVENTLPVGSAGTIPQTRAENDFVFSAGASKHEQLNRRFIQ